MPADFKPTMSVIKDLHPFRYWCSKVLPTVYDDSLSYYELLTKVLKYLNDSMENVDTLNDNVNSIYESYLLLEDYVNNYFESQDFQSMVNAKLDEMAETGVFDDILEPIANNYLTEKTTEINTRLGEQDAMIQLQNGSIDSLESQMAEFVRDHAGPIEMVTLFNGYADAQGTEIALSDSPSNYEFIDVYYATGGAEWCPNIFRFPANKFHTSTGVRVNVSHGENDAVDKRLSVYSMRIIPADSVNDKLYTVTQASHWLWDGTSASNALNYANNSTDASQESPAVLKIIGVRNSQNDAEIINARVGYDGHVYTTVGEAIRDQISDLNRELVLNSGLPMSVKTALDTLLQNVAFKNNNVYTDEIAVIHNWVTSVNLISISAVFTQGTNVIYETDSLDMLRQYLTVTANYDNGTSEVVSGYTLSGQLTEGTSTITVTYGGETATFNVTVTGTPFARYTGGLALAKIGGTQYTNVITRSNMTPTARACMDAPIPNENYVFNSADTSKYQIAVYDVQNLDRVVFGPGYDEQYYPDGYGYQGGTKTVAWTNSDSVTTPYVWVAFKKLDGTDFTSAELANMEGTVFTYTQGA